jgi:VCBS repeat-containing protein
LEANLTATASVSPTGNPYIDGVLSGTEWATSNLTYSFPTSASYYEYGGEPGNNFKAFTAVQQDAVHKALANYSAVANLTFTEVTETSTQHATLRYAESDSPSTAWAYYPSTSAQGGDAWYGNSSHWYDNPLKGSYGYQAMLHETGHALGLKHPHEASGAFGPMPLDHDSLEYSVMSYHSYIGSPTNGYTNAFYDGYPQTLMMYDIAAVQEMYGPNFSTNGGDSVYRWSPVTGEMSINGVGQGAPAGNKIFMTVWDGGGHDTYDFSNYTTNLSVNLQPGEWSTASTAQLADLGGGHFAAGNIANALLYHGNTASLIEDVIGGSGNDRIVGNTADNHFTGGAGDDSLDGGAGNDTAIFAGNHDNFVWAENSNGSWTVTDLTGAQGVDTLWNIENLQFGDTIVSIGTAPPVVTNAAPTITSAASKVSLTEWADNSAAEVANTPHTATGTITYSDPDLAQLHAASVKPQGTNYLGTFSLNTSNIDSNQSVGWSFTVSDSAIDYLKAGQTLTQNYDVTVDDGHGGSTVQTVTVTLIGADDATTKVAKGGAGKGFGKGNGNDVATGDFDGRDVHLATGDVPSIRDMLKDQAPAPYQTHLGLHLPDSVHMPEAALSALTHVFESIWHV